MRPRRHKVGIIVQRWHPSVTGGSEAHAWQYACLLRERYAVDLITTTALDAASWKSELEPSQIEEQGVTVRRFEVEAQRSDYWRRLHIQLVADAGDLKSRRYQMLDHRDNWPIALQREFIAKQGPWVPKLWRYLHTSQEQYAALIFVTYLYPTTYFGIEATEGHPNILLVPTLHDEAPAYLSTYQRMARSARSILWNTEAERRLAFGLWGPLNGSIVSMAIRSAAAQKETRNPPYLLYSGRIDTHKGCSELFDFFGDFKKRYPSPLRLKLTGQRVMEIPPHPEIEFLGFVTDEEKARLMSEATVFLMPSANESLSIVSLEAMAQRTPVLASARSLVVAEHLAKSGGGITYTDRESFITALNELLTSPARQRTMGARGRAYVIENYDERVVQGRLFRAIERYSFAPL